MEDDAAIINAFSPLYNDPASVSDTFPNKRPLLAHYTSMVALERILYSNEIWFSNPLFMNDLEELRFGLIEGTQLFCSNEAIKAACGQKERFDTLNFAFNHYSNVFTDQYALDTYVFCLSEHNDDNTDGLLSMWRGYGGNGKGAAIVFDSTKVNYMPESPLIIARVSYSSTEDRLSWLNSTINDFAAILSKLNIPDNKLYLAAHTIFNRILQFALFSKHHGFAEEKEWRIVYMKSRDTKGQFKSMFDYATSNRGIEPKLKLKIGFIEGLIAKEFSLSKIIHRIILGPTRSNFLARGTVLRMLEKVGKPELKERVSGSTIPFRSL